MRPDFFIIIITIAITITITIAIQWVLRKTLFLCNSYFFDSKLPAIRYMHTWTLLSSLSRSRWQRSGIPVGRQKHSQHLSRYRANESTLTQLGKAQVSCNSRPLPTTAPVKLMRFGRRFWKDVRIPIVKSIPELSQILETVPNHQFLF